MVARVIAAFFALLFAGLVVTMAVMTTYAIHDGARLPGLMAISFGLCCLSMVYRFVTLGLLLQRKAQAERTPVE